jgi:hypothetical protein
VAAAAAVSAEKAAPVPARRPHATRAKLRIKTLEHKPQQLQKPEQLDRPSIPTEATSATNFPRLAMRHSLAPPLGMWSAAAGQTMPPTLGRSYQARVVFFLCGGAADEDDDATGGTADAAGDAELPRGGASEGACGFLFCSSGNGAATDDDVDADGVADGTATEDDATAE